MARTNYLVKVPNGNDLPEQATMALRFLELKQACLDSATVYERIAEVADKGGLEVTQHPFYSNDLTVELDADCAFTLVKDGILEEIDSDEYAPHFEDEVTQPAAEG